MSSLDTDGHQWQRLLLFGLLALCLLDRARIIVEFGARFTSADDAVFWAVADDMANGSFREPFLYGQDYNPALESLLAVPLLLARVPIHVAMPIAVSLLALAPFLFWGWWHARRHEWVAASAFIAMPLLLPVQWGMLTTMSRGFVGGLAILAFLPLTVRIAREQWRFAAVGTITALALAANPITLLFALPFTLAQWLETDGRWRAALALLLGTTPSVLLAWQAQHFYQLHPERVVHGLSEGAFSMDSGRLLHAITTLDSRFIGLCPVWWPNGHVVLWLIALTSVVLWRTGLRATGIALFATLALIIASFALSKAADGTTHLFYPQARMYLALPLVLAWSVARFQWSLRLTRVLPVITLMACCASLAWKALHAPAVIAQELASTAATPVAPLSVQRLEDDARIAAGFKEERGVDLIVTLFGEGAQPFMALNYAGPILEPGMPRTLFLAIDRRFWRRREERDAVRPRVLFVGADESYWSSARKGVPEMEVVPFGTARARLLKDNTLTTGELLRRMGWDLGPMP